jgi:hypothetical protein
MQMGRVTAQRFMSCDRLLDNNSGPHADDAYGNADANVPPRNQTSIIHVELRITLQHKNYLEESFALAAVPEGPSSRVPKWFHVSFTDKVCTMGSILTESCSTLQLQGTSRPPCIWVPRCNELQYPKARQLLGMTQEGS